MNRIVLHTGFVLSLAGLALVGAGCVSGFEPRMQPVMFESETPAVEETPPVVEPAPAEPVLALAEEPVSAEEDAVSEPARRPWYKRLWRKATPAGAEAAPAPESVPVEEEAPPEEPTLVEEPIPVEEEAASEPVRRPWYKRLWRTRAVKSPEKIDMLESDGMFSPSGEPLIKVGYLLRLSVSAGGRTEVPEQARKVSDKGEISLPLVGSVVCEGLTLQELSDKISKLYEQYIRDPLVSVEFVYDGRPGEISPWGAVVVSGEVNQPGRVNIPPTRDLTLSRAIQLVGGAPKTADESAIVVFRRLKDGSVKKIVVNLLAVTRRGQMEKDIVLEPGDSIYVPESVW